MTDIAANLARINAQIVQATQQRGPGPEVRLIAVSKRHPVEAIEIAYAAGQRDFGENYAQELEQKMQALKSRCPGIRWHMIGPVQRNKVPKLLGRVLIHTVDRRPLVRALQTRAEAQGLSQACLVQVNPGEAQKSGIEALFLGEILEEIEDASALECHGLMMIPPNAGPQVSGEHFSWLAKLSDKYREKFHSSNPVLSMGMSNDFSSAILAGSTMVRVGRAIFGPRPSTAG